MSENERNQKQSFFDADVVPELPARFPSGRGEPFPEDLVGSEIISIGTLADSEAVEGGGLVIDYRKPQEQLVRRAVFAFNELGMWVAQEGFRR